MINNIIYKNQLINKKSIKINFPDFPLNSFKILSLITIKRLIRLDMIIFIIRIIIIPI